MLAARVLASTRPRTFERRSCCGGRAARVDGRNSRRCGTTTTDRGGGRGDERGCFGGPSRSSSGVSTSMDRPQLRFRTSTVHTRAVGSDAQGWIDLGAESARDVPARGSVTSRFSGDEVGDPETVTEPSAPRLRRLRRRCRTGGRPGRRARRAPPPGRRSDRP